jgi:hypothetical protein
MKNKFVLIFSIFSLLILFASGAADRAFACSCGPRDISLSESLGAAKAVFIGAVTADNGRSSSVDIRPIRSYTILVKESFADDSQGLKLEVQTGENCGFNLEVGKTYLVYADENNGVLYISFCSRSRLFSHVKTEELEFLASSKKDISGTTLSGKVTGYIKSSLISEEEEPQPRLKMRLENVVGDKKAVDVTTDNFGNYEITGVARGKYTLRPDIPEHWRMANVYKEFIELDINGKGRVKNDISIVNKSEVFVKVLDHEGKPVKSIWVEFVPVEISFKTVKNYPPREFGATNAEGGLYTFDLPPGRYSVSVNYFFPPDKEHPFPATFYPGTTDRANTETIEVKAGSRIDNLILRIPKQIKEREIKANVVWADGTSAANVQIYMVDDINRRYCINGCERTTDAGGNFSMPGYDGRTYFLTAKAEKTVNGKVIRFVAQSGPILLTEQLLLTKLIMTEER